MSTLFLHSPANRQKPNAGLIDLFQRPVLGSVADLGGVGGGGAVLKKNVVSTAVGKCLYSFQVCLSGSEMFRV